MHIFSKILLASAALVTISACSTELSKEDQAALDARVAEENKQPGTLAEVAVAEADLQGDGRGPAEHRLKIKRFRSVFDAEPGPERFECALLCFRDGAPQDHEDLLESATREAHHQYTLGLASHGHGGSRSNYR